MIKVLDHVALSVTNLEKSIAFYCDLIGMQVVRIIECPPERGLGVVTGMPACSARIAHLQPRNRLASQLASQSAGHSSEGAIEETPVVKQTMQAMLELFEYKYPVGERITSDRKQADIGFTHIGFSTDDAKADYERLKAHGVSFVSAPIEFRPEVWLFYFYGPDGEVCELRQS